MDRNVMLLVLVLFFANLFLTGDAIRCQQCNSYLDPGCADLDLSGGGPQGEKYLKDCEGVGETIASFCRKLDVTFFASDERRIVRTCGYLLPKHKGIDYCFSADNEGYSEKICQCYGDGCNSAPRLIRSFSAIVVVLVSYICLIY
ncbi:uncharacterized protein LOC119656809 isoform X2 [Hermetia illucens]|nr:uncharacterized protein LOC119656809 isoform X2 [Hermetia illucens]XP_037919377.1 uncharacterized protein LOC119656809 isoform X2 [Hermetia illucens]XP_037919386.1 uncharacterized protein LOC119656809 isoform X2 [Hermetia illucens]